MGVNYIPFLQCVIENDNSEWQPVHGYPHGSNVTTREIYDALKEDAYAALVDLERIRRYLSFRRGSRVNIVGNVFVYNSKDANELSVDDAKKLGRDILNS